MKTYHLMLIFVLLALGIFPVNASTVCDLSNRTYQEHLPITFTITEGDQDTACSILGHGDGSGTSGSYTYYNLAGNPIYVGSWTRDNPTVTTNSTDAWTLATGTYCTAGGSVTIHEYHAATCPLDRTDQDFIGYPLDGYSPISVIFTSLNMTNTSAFQWTFGDGSTGTGVNVTHIYNNPGIYSVSLGFYNKSGVAGTITKNNYVLVSNVSGMIVNLDVKDAISGALIQDSTVGIKNTSSGVWRNTTAPTGLVYFSTTDPGYLYPMIQGQSITLAANKTGYNDASTTFNIPYNNYRSRLFLMPLNVINSTGTGTVVVNTIRNKDGLTISGISVVLDSGQIGLTNTAGATTLYNVSAGTRYATVTDPDKGYQDTKTSFNLTAGETKLVVIQMVRVGEQPVETPGSPTPTPTGTYDPADPNSPVYGNYTTSQINEQGGAGVLGMLLQLIQLWPLIVVFALMKFIKSATS